ncbi:unnamed protein product [Pleuronectes platessa]|uniref:Uncharacterized protein n=1 Tax=Pleuronectes platessa TaxID=8262 RepID=A0A9N7Z473_PLEPL|nr:unnamed protein product [Pleuronectes platessa]
MCFFVFGEFSASKYSPAEPHTLQGVNWYHELNCAAALEELYQQMCATISVGSTVQGRRARGRRSLQREKTGRRRGHKTEGERARDT